jgi:beta-lactamase regulating signal transducer with metallopeptidase domain
MPTRSIVPVIKSENNDCSTKIAAVDQEKAADRLGLKPQTKKIRSTFVRKILRKGFFQETPRARQLASGVSKLNTLSSAKYLQTMERNAPNQ